MHRSALYCALLLLLIPAAALPAQGAQIVTPAADTLPPAAVPLAEIPTRAAATEARLDEIWQSLPSDRAFQRVAAAYSAAQDTISAVVAMQKERGPEDKPTRRSLTDLHNEWLRRIEQMRAWQQTIGSQSSATAGIQKELIRRDSTWRLTLAEVQAAKASPDVADLVDNVLERNAVLRDTVEARIVAVVRLQSRITRTIAVLQQADERTTEQLASIRGNLLRIDSPPLWKGLGRYDTAQAAGAEVRSDAARTWQQLKRFHEAYRLPLYIHLGSTLLILIAVFWFRGQLDRHTAEQPAAAVRRVLDRPVAGAWLVVTVAALLLYPRAPLSVYDLAMLAGIPALIRLLPSVLPQNLVRPAIAWSLLFAVQRLGGLFLSTSVVARPGSLVVALAGATLLLWLLRQGGQLRALGTDAYAVALRVAGWLAAATLVGAAVSNIVGNVSLGQFLAGGTVTSTYFLLVVLAAVQIFDGILIVVTRSEAASTSRFVAGRKDLLVRDGIRVVQLLSALAWIVITLTVFDVAGPTWGLIRGWLAATLTVGQVHLSLGAVLLFLTTVWVSVLLSRAIAGVLEMDLLGRLDMPKGLPSVVGRLTRYTLMGLGVIIALAATGLDLTKLTILGGALGVGVGFGLQTMVSNFVAGLILAFERPIREGDFIQIQELTGEVRRIGFRATIVRTFEGSEVIVPNASLISNDVVNWTLSDQQRRLTVSVGVAYGTDPARVMEVLLGVPPRFPSILKVPAPMALFTGFGDSALNFELRFWTVDADRFVILRSEVTTAVNNALVAAGIEIPFPQRDLHLRSVEGTAAARLREPPHTDKEPA